MLKKIMPLVLVFSLLIACAVKAEEISKEKDAEYREIYGDNYEANSLYMQDRAREENNRIEEEIIRQLKIIMPPEKLKETISYLQKSQEDLYDFYWALYAENKHVNGMGSLDKLISIHARGAHLKAILEHINSGKSLWLADDLE